MFRRFIFLLLLLATRLAAAAPVTFAPAQAIPELNTRFTATNGWIGADGDYTVALSPTRTLWLFSDTWVGRIRDGHRTHATLVNNTLALQDGVGTNAKVQFIIRHDPDGKPTAFLTPADRHGWFWPQSAACQNNQLYLFLAQIEKSGTGGVFGFRQTGEWLGLVTNPLAPPLEWHIARQKLPCTRFTPDRQITFGAATLVAGDYLYIYGTDEDTRPATRDRHLILARAPLDAIADLTAWRYYSHDRWTNDFHDCTRLANQLATECSVTRLPQSAQYVLVYTDRGFSPKIMARTAPTPWGEWSAPSVLYECPEMGREKNFFTYAAKAHPELTDGPELILTYAVNSFDFWQVAKDATLYWPRFLRIPLVIPK